jgi:hypothetical protein
MEPFLLQIGQINRRCGFRTGNKTTQDFEIYQIYRTVDVLWSIKVLWNDIDAKDCRADTLLRSRGCKIYNVVLVGVFELATSAHR